ncbi:hypothetical protein DIPPA_31855 [Diplonema papillatum]|nr:hypothetical protein DIPPA_31855 [Diplonema papillatum]
MGLPPASCAVFASLALLPLASLALDECAETCDTCPNDTCASASQLCEDPVATPETVSDWMCVCQRNTTQTAGATIGDGVYSLESKWTPKLLDVRDIELGDDAFVVVNLPTGSDSQLWSVIHVADGYYRLTNLQSSKALTVANASMDVGAALVQHTWLGEDDQLFSFNEQIAGFYMIVNKNSQYAMDLYNWNPRNDAQIKQHRQLPVNSVQNWKFIFASAAVNGIRSAVGKAVADCSVDECADPMQSATCSSSDQECTDPDLHRFGDWGCSCLHPFVSAFAAGRSAACALPPTPVPPTLAPATPAPPTMAPTAAPFTPAPATLAPPTAAPLTPAPATLAPPTGAPPTTGPVLTFVPATDSPETRAPATAAPSTFPPVTLAPLTFPPATSAPATSAPGTSVPVAATLAPPNETAARADEEFEAAGGGKASAVASALSVAGTGASASFSAGILALSSATCFGDARELSFVLSPTQLKLPGPNGPHSGCIVGNAGIIAAAMLLRLAVSGILGFAAVQRCLNACADANTTMVSALISFSAWWLFIFSVLYQGFCTCGMLLMLHAEGVEEALLAFAAVVSVLVAPIAGLKIIQSVVPTRKAVHVVDPVPSWWNWCIGKGEWVSLSENSVERYGSLFQHHDPEAVFYSLVYGCFLSVCFAAIYSVETTSWTQCGYKKLAMLAAKFVYLSQLVWRMPYRQAAVNVLEVAVEVAICLGLLLAALASFSANPLTHWGHATSQHILLFAAFTLLLRSILSVVAVAYVTQTGRRTRLELWTIARRPAAAVKKVEPEWPPAEDESAETESSGASDTSERPASPPRLSPQLIPRQNNNVVRFGSCYDRDHSSFADLCRSECSTVKSNVPDVSIQLMQGTSDGASFASSKVAGTPILGDELFPLSPFYAAL